MKMTTRDALISLTAMVGLALGGWFLQFAWFLGRLILAAAIGWGIVTSLKPFPYETVRSWQELLSAGTPDFPGAQLFLWCADQWLQLAILVLLLNSMRTRRVLSGVGLTSHHAAFAATALANYMSISPSTPRLLGIEEKSDKGFWKSMWSEVVYERILRIFAGAPFLPDEVIPERQGHAASLKEDLEQFATGGRREEGLEPTEV